MSERRLTGTYWPVGLNHPYLHRSSEPCEIVGYDHAPDRDVPLTFLIKFPDGVAIQALPEELDDSVPRKDDLWSPAPQKRQRGRYTWNRAANGHFQTSFMFGTYLFTVRVMELAGYRAGGVRQFHLSAEAVANGQILADGLSPLPNPESLLQREAALQRMVGHVTARAEAREKQYKHTLEERRNRAEP